ncbi:MAG: cell wall metabolism sensor histidine kinase WalK [Chloroflexi bacterium]|nr:cell wall metabolism sensor histidine kinase WalK [Chloroflexota bacterium]
MRAVRSTAGTRSVSTELFERPLRDSGAGPQNSATLCQASTKEAAGCSLEETAFLRPYSILHHVPQAVKSVFIFERFYRISTAGTHESQALGLYISRLIAEAHGGRIWAESEVGKGSTFCVTLPLA